MTLTLTGGDARIIFQVDFLNNARTVWPRTTKFGRIIHVGSGVFLGGQVTLPQGAGPYAQSHFWGSLLFIHTHHLTQNYQIWRGNTYGKGPFSDGQPRLIQRKQGPSAPHFWGFLLIYACTLCHRIRPTKLDVVTYVGEARVSRLPSQDSGVSALSILAFSRLRYSSIYALFDLQKHGVVVIFGP